MGDIQSAGEPYISQADNHSEATIYLPRPDLEITKTGNVEGFFHPDFLVAYNIAFTNTGTLTAPHIIISDTFSQFTAI